MQERMVKCIVCPISCDVLVELDGNKVVSVRDNQCQRGEQYAIDECTFPCRMLATTIKTHGAKLPIVSVRTDRPIPKKKIFDCMEIIRKTVVNEPFSVGDIVVSNIADTGANIIITRADLSGK